MDLSQVVIELAVLRDCILQVWDRERTPGSARPEIRFLNRSVDRAIAAIARGIIEAHRGRIWVESRPGAGTTFRLTVPVA
jgi:histidine kinase/DNA gyrase B/HSP90-like ATPase